MENHAGMLVLPKRISCAVGAGLKLELHADDDGAVQEAPLGFPESTEPFAPPADIIAQTLLGVIGAMDVESDTAPATADPSRPTNGK